MGNCCCCDDSRSGRRRENSGAFQGQGHRLGSGGEYGSPPPNMMISERSRKDEISQPIVDHSLDEDTRDLRRAEAARAAELRSQQNKGSKKKPAANKEPLKGPNSQPLMKWTMASAKFQVHHRNRINNFHAMEQINVFGKKQTMNYLFDSTR